jgi:RNA polymerase sigma-70 factor, ECF subfamily
VGDRRVQAQEHRVATAAVEFDEVRSLVDRSLAGDGGAATDLVERFRGVVFGLCYRMLGQRQDAEDVSQEAFARAFRSLRGFDAARDFRPWLLAIAGNRCRSFLASQRRRPALVEMADGPVDLAEDPQRERNLAEEVQLALRGLREDHRKAFLLFHEQHLSYEEIATALGCPVGTVKTWVHRARRDLAAALRQRGAVQEGRRAL